MSRQTATRERTDQQVAPREAPAGNLPATTDNKPKHPLVQFQEYAQQRMEQLQFALPSHISPDRFTRVLMTALQRKADLLKCTRQSLWNACLLAAQDGLMPDGREGAIVPYGENADGKKQAEIATWMPMIEGLRKKARNSGEIADWMVQVVYARDHFRFALGDKSFIEHEPYWGPEEPGEIIGAYSIATMRDGTKSREVMSRRELDKIRAKSRAKNGPWGDPTFLPEMYKKTVARRHYKQLPHSSDLDEMVKRDDQAFGLEDRDDHQIEARQARRVTSVNAAFDQFAGGAVEYDHTASADQQQDHDPETGEVIEQDEPHPEPPVEEKPAAPKPEAKSKPAAEKPRQQKEPAKPAPAPKPDPEPAPEPAQQQDEVGSHISGDPVDDIPDEIDSKPSSDAGIDEDARDWPPEDVPTDIEEYEQYLDTQIKNATGARALQNSFVNDGELRKKCGVDQARYGQFVDKVKRHMDTLKQQGKA